MKTIFILVMTLIPFLVGFQKVNSDQTMMDKMSVKDSDIRVATFAGGCFRCTEADFEKLPGVVKVVSGYTGGTKEMPSYEEVSAGGTGHIEAIQVYYDPDKLSYEELLNYLWKHIDPTDAGGQFADRGSQYRSAIFYHDEEQKGLAEESKETLNQSGKFEKPVVTDILMFTNFYEAEEYHQDYRTKNPMRYKFYRYVSGRDEFLKQTLSPLQFKVTRKNGTERPFQNEYWDNKKAGIYVDIISGEPLFSSLDKFKSGTGWPSFTRPLEPENIVEIEDRSIFMSRTEVRSKNADSHLGHLFPDGPKPTGLRYCMNSASLRFIPKEDLEKEGYGGYLKLFEEKS